MKTVAPRKSAAILTAALCSLVLSLWTLSGASSVVVPDLEEIGHQSTLPAETGQPDDADEPASSHLLPTVMSEQASTLINLYCTQARTASSFNALSLGELVEIREAIGRSPRLDLVLRQLAMSTTCQPQDDDSIATRYYLSRLILDVMSSARQRADELELQRGGRTAFLSTPVPGGGSNMPGTAPENVEDPVQRAAYILRMEENGRIALFGGLGFRISYNLNGTQVRLRRIIRAHVNAGTDEDRAFLMDLLDVDEIMSKTDREDFDEWRNRPAPPRPDE